MFRSPPNLRSGTKGQPVRLSDKSDKKSVELLSKRPESTDKPNTCASNMSVDQTVIADCVARHLADGDIINTLVTRVTSELRNVVGEAVRAALMDVSKEVEKLRGEVNSLRAAVTDLDHKLMARTDELEQYTRRNNVRIFGVAERTGEDTDLIVRELCRDKLGVELREEALCRTHRVGRQPQPGPNGEKRHRPIIVRFVSYRDRRLVYGAKKNLKGSGITVREDLTSQRLEVLKKAIERHGLRRTWSLDGRVFWLDKDGRKGVATTLADLDRPTSPNSK